MDTTSLEEVVFVLRKLYAEVKKKANWIIYAKKSAKRFRQKHFLRSQDEKIINNEHYTIKNEMFKTVIVKINKQVKGTATHKEPICSEDL